jgi:hypothetical protein
MLKAALMGANARMSSIARMGRVALVGAMVAAALPFVSSCSKDDENAGVYVPPADLSTAEIVQLVKNANAAFSTAKQYTLVEYETGKEDGMEYTYKSERQVDKVAKKRLRTTSITVPSQNVNNLLTNFSYIEDSKDYYFDWDIDSPEDLITGTGKSYTLYNLTAEDLNSYFGDGEDFVYGLDDSYYIWTWKVENGMLVGRRTNSLSYYYKYELTLDADKRFKNEVYTSGYNINDVTYTIITSISYDANPTFPAGFNKADFKENNGWFEEKASRVNRAKAIRE